MDNKRIEIVKKLYDALPEMDWDTYRAHIHPNFRVVETESLPYAGIFPGIEGFLKLIGRVFELYSEFEATPSTITSGENHVMVKVNIKMTGRKSNKTINTQLIEVFKFEGDKLIEICPFYFDTDLINSIS